MDIVISEMGSNRGEAKTTGVFLLIGLESYFIVIKRLQGL